MKTIAIVGIGGVGGFIGAKMAKAFEKSNEFQIVFITRGKNLDAINEHGIIAETTNGIIHAKPTLAMEDGKISAPFDFVIICVKGYDLISAAEKIKYNIHGSSVILPLLNGLEAPSVLKNIFPKSTVLKGCCYMVSEVMGPGRILESGNTHKVFFEDYPSDELSEIFQLSGINAEARKDMEEVVWTKFLFVAPLAAVSTLYKVNSGVVFKNKEAVDLMKKLMKEIYNLSVLKNISLPENIMEITLEKISRLPAHAKTSMQRDFENKKRMESNWLFDYVIREGARLNSPVGFHKKVLEKLSS